MICWANGANTHSNATYRVRSFLLRREENHKTDHITANKPGFLDIIIHIVVAGEILNCIVNGKTILITRDCLSLRMCSGVNSAERCRVPVEENVVEITYRFLGKNTYSREPLYARMVHG